MYEKGQVAGSGRSYADEMLCLAVEDAISRSEPIRASSLRSIVVEATDGHLVLRGLIGSDSLRYLAEQLAAAVPGVMSVQNLLVAREDLERTIALALGSAEETRHLRIMVRAAGRVPTLYGVVASQAEADAALLVARKAVHDLEVHSALRVLPADEPVLVLEQHSVEGRELAAVSREQQQPQEPAAHGEQPPTVNTPPAAPAEGLA